MWLLVFFDLPTQTDKQKKHATRFRKNLLQQGFTRFQYSIYIRHCGSHAHANVFERRVRIAVPKEGHVSILRITDSQFSNIRNFWGGKEKKKHSRKLGSSLRFSKKRS